MARAGARSIPCAEETWVQNVDAVTCESSMAAAHSASQHADPAYASVASKEGLMLSATAIDG
jgi:hypothetical protein